MVQTPTTLILEEFLKLLETKPASEYIDGQIIQKPMPLDVIPQVCDRLTSTSKAMWVVGLNAA